jgi:folylpolyglutamate synthase/dihydropteroate synthase
VEAFARTPAEAELSGEPSALDPDIVRRAVATMSSPGRLEIVRRSPVVILDAAHNPGGMTASVAALTEAFSFTDLIAIIAVAEDKDVAGILDELEPVVAHLVVTANSSPRSMTPPALAEVAATVFGADRITVADRLDDAIELGVALADEADAAAEGGPGKAGVLITGSVITAGDARVLLADRAGNAHGPAESRPAQPGGPGEYE